MTWKKMMPWVMVLAFPVLAGAEDLGARRGPEGSEPGHRRPPSSLELLLEHQEALALTPEQVARVSELQAELVEQTEPLHQQLWALKPPRPPPESARLEGVRPGGEPPDAAEMRERMRQAEPLFRELRDQDTAAYARAEQVLSDSQKARARELIDQTREEHRRRHEALRERMGGRP
jgi:hypothetical protein